MVLLSTENTDMREKQNNNNNTPLKGNSMKFPEKTIMAHISLNLSGSSFVD